MKKIDLVVIWMMAIALVVLTGVTLYQYNKYEELKIAYNEVVENNEDLVEAINSRDEKIQEIETEFDEFEDQVFRMKNKQSYKFTIYRSEDNTYYTYEGNGKLFGDSVLKVTTY